MMSRFIPSMLFLVLPTVVGADDWPGWMGPQRDGVWREKGIVSKFPAGGPKVLWKSPVGMGYSGPAVVGDRVYITDRILGQKANNPKSPFDSKTKVEGRERVLCLDAKTGAEIWKYEYDCPYQVSYAAGPRATPLVAEGKVYALGTMGHLYCFDAKEGNVLWSKLLTKDYNAPVPYWGWSASPLLDGDRLIILVGGPNSTVVAFHKDTGKEIWKSMNSPEIGYAPPVLADIQGQKQLLVWHPLALNGLNPETGAVYWSQQFPDKKAIKANLTVGMPRVVGNKIYVTAFYDGHMLVEINNNTPKVLYRSKGRSEQPDETDGLHSIMPTPFIEEGTIYGICSYGELRGLDFKTGERLWETLKATSGKSTRWGNAFLVEHEDRYFLFNEQGDMIIAKLTPKGYEEISRARLVEPLNTMAMGRKVVWTHPAFAHKSAFVRNDAEIIRVDLSAK